MTVGIGLLCDGGKHILLAADMRGSYGTLSNHDQTAKLFDLPYKFCGAVAGSLGQCTDVISALFHRMSQVPDPEILPAQVMACIRESYHGIWQELADEALRNQLKITREQFMYDKNLARRVHQSAVDVLKTLELDVDLIVAGFCKGTPIHLVARGGQR